MASPPSRGPPCSPGAFISPGGAGSDFRVFLLPWAPKEKRRSVDGDVCGWLPAPGNAGAHGTPLLPWGGGAAGPGVSQGEVSFSWIKEQAVKLPALSSWPWILFFPPLLEKVAFWVCHKQRSLALIPFFFGGQAAAPPLGTP